MRIIPEDIRKDVEKIAQNLVKYDNKKKLSWLKAYKDVLKSLGMENRRNDDRLLSYVVSQITNLGYDIKDDPFGLERFR